LPEPLDFAVVYARFLPAIQAKCRRLLGRAPAAEDVAQETFLRLWKSGLARGDERDDPRTIMAWLYRTCTRLAIDVLRERRRTDLREVDLDATPCGLDEGACVEARAAIASLASSVTEDELEVAVLCRVDCLSQPEAAGVLGVSERTVRRMLERFDQRTLPLRKELSS
jgi:RNA polymerase sigma-70 factor (ECF subfamily)